MHCANCPYQQPAFCKFQCTEQDVILHYELFFVLCSSSDVIEMKKTLGMLTVVPIVVAFIV